MMIRRGLACVVLIAYLGSFRLTSTTGTGNGNAVRHQVQSSQNRIMRIAGFYEKSFVGAKAAMLDAVAAVNSRNDLLRDVTLVADVETVPAQDSFLTGKKVCHQLQQGVAAVFGPMSTDSAIHIRSIGRALEVPHIESRWDVTRSAIAEFPGGLSTYAVDSGGSQSTTSINVHPDSVAMSRAFYDFIVHQDWTSFTILYTSDDAIMKHHNLISAFSGGPVRVNIRKLEQIPADSGDYRTVLKDVRNHGDSRFLLDCEWYAVHDILHQAMTVNMTLQYFHYMLTTLDVGLVDLDDFRYSGVNVTAFRLINPDQSLVREITRHWSDLRNERPEEPSPLETDRGFTTEAALVYDAVHLFAKALNLLSRIVHATPLSCNHGRTWQHGQSLINYMKTIHIDGLTGRVFVDANGHRTSFSLDLLELTTDGVEKIGMWTSLNGINITKKYDDTMDAVADSLKNKTLVITTILEDPYVMLRNDSSGEIKGNARFKGFCIDLLEEIAKIAKFEYVIKLVDDGKYGAPVGVKGEWNGMVRELMDRKADLAVASLTISYLREQVIDFTKPFMNLGISILFRRPKNKTPSLFSFLSPLSIEIWIYILIAYLAVSFVLFAVARFSPYEWYNPHPCNPNSDTVHNQFSLSNSLWFNIGSLMQQGCEIGPKALSTRIVSCTWWFFTLILISSYTANLAAFLTVERMKSPIENADDLAKQTEISYGTIYGGSTMSFFKTSQIPTYSRMWNYMSDSPHVFVNSTREGVEAVRTRNYAFLLESTMNEYITQRNCDLMQVGGLLDSKGYGIGTPRGSPYRDILSDVILKLQEDQTLQMLYNRWWKEKDGAGMCDVEEKGKKDASSLAIANVGGVFVVLAVGLILSIVAAIGEFVWNAQRRRPPDYKANGDQPSLCAEMNEAFRFAVRCFAASRKPAPASRPKSLPTNGVVSQVPALPSVAPDCAPRPVGNGLSSMTSSASSAGAGVGGGRMLTAPSCAVPSQPIFLRHRNEITEVNN